MAAIAVITPGSRRGLSAGRSPNSRGSCPCRHRRAVRGHDPAGTGSRQSGRPRPAAPSAPRAATSTTAHHVGVAAEMVGLHEGAVRLLRDVAQMHEVDPVGEPPRDRRHVVCGTAPSEPVQSVMPFARDGTASRMKARSSAFETMRGRPMSGRGGSSGWIAMRIPTSSAVGITSRRNRARFSRSRRGGDVVVARQHAAQAGMS